MGIVLQNHPHFLCVFCLSTALLLCGHTYLSSIMLIMETSKWDMVPYSHYPFISSLSVCPWNFNPYGYTLLGVFA